MTTPFDDPALAAWFIGGAVDLPFAGSVISTVGSGPLPEATFDSLLSNAGLEITDLSPDTEVLIIGRKDWSEQELRTLIDQRSGMRLRAYSQEMFLTLCTTGRDPLEDRSVAEAFGREHSALQFLSELGFDWPSIFVASGSGGVAAVLAPELGLLRAMGYRVGASGLVCSARRAILSRAFKSSSALLPAINSRDYMVQWGEAESKERLQKMADSIAMFCTLQESKGNELAASHYREDLEWLRKKYYVGRFTFRWPGTWIA